MRNSTDWHVDTNLSLPAPCQYCVWREGRAGTCEVEEDAKCEDCVVVYWGCEFPIQRSQGTRSSVYSDVDV